MEIVIGIVVALIVAAVAGGVGLYVGNGMAKNNFKELAKQPIAGQTVNVRGIGDVFILGRAHDDVNDDGEITDDEEFIDYIAVSVMEEHGAKTPADLDEDVLDAHTVSVPLHQFVLQCDFVRSQMFQA